MRFIKISVQAKCFSSYKLVIHADIPSSSIFRMRRNGLFTETFLDRPMHNFAALKHRTRFLG